MISDPAGASSDASSHSGARTQFWPAWQVCLAALLGCAISIAIDGYHFGVDNNIYHVPFVLNWDKDPAFANDAFVQSLRNYVSGWWWGVRLVATEGNLHALFFAMHAVSRWLGIIALVIAAMSLGIASRPMQIALAVWYGMTPLLTGDSQVGSDGLFIANFTHTELTHPLALIAIALAARGWIVAAFALIGVIFDINAFVAVWTGVTLAFVCAGLIHRRPADWRGIALKAAAGLAAALVIALPVLAWIYSSTHAQPAFQKFDYLTYLWSFYPNHFLIAAAHRKELIALGALVLAGFIGLRLAGPRGDPWRFAFIGFCAVFAIGALVPFVTHAPMILNLHLLRVDGKLQFLTIAALSAVAARWFERGGEARLAGATSIAILSLPLAAGTLLAAALLWLGDRRNAAFGYIAAALGLAAVALSFHRAMPFSLAMAGIEALIVIGFLVFRRFAATSGNTLKYALGAALAAIVLSSAALAFINNHPPVDLRREAYLDVARWARVASPPASVFLAPIGHGVAETEFQIEAHRPVWVDMKRGAAVMWMPSYYAQWTERVADVEGLKSLAEKIAYACRNNIDFIVHEGPRGDAPHSADIVFSNDYFVVVGHGACKDTTNPPKTMP